MCRHIQSVPVVGQDNRRKADGSCYKYEEWMELGEITEETPIEWYEEEHARAILVSEIDRQTADLSEEEAFDIFTKLMEGDPLEVLKNLRTEGKLSKDALEELEEYEEEYQETHGE